MFSKTLTVISTLLATTCALPMNAAELVSAADFATNVVMTSGASQFAMWVGIDGNVVFTSALTCLNILASSTGSCDIPNIDQIAAVSGYTCAWQGSAGWQGSQVGTSETGWVKVAPPQTITAAACMNNS